MKTLLIVSKSDLRELSAIPMNEAGENTTLAASETRRAVLTPRASAEERWRIGGESNDLA